MRKVVHAFWRGFLGLGRVSVAWIPALTLLIMGGLYLFNCLMVLAAPGTGFDLTYIGRGGAIRIVSDSYAVDPIRQTADAYGIRVTDLQGNEIAQAKRVHISRKSSSIVADVVDLSGTIVRRQDGTFSALDLLPPENPDATPMAFRLTVNRADIMLEDRTGPTPIYDEFALNAVDFSTDGKLNVISADLDWADVLEGQVQLQLDSKNNFAVDVANFRGDLVKARPTVERWVDPKSLEQIGDWSAISLLVTGDLHLAGTEKGLEDFRGELAIAGRGVKHPDYFAGASVDGRVTLYPKSAVVTARIDEPGRTATWDGPVSWSDGFAGQGKVQVELADSRRAWPIVEKSLPADILLTGSQFNGVVGLTKDGFSASGGVVAKSASIMGEQFTGIAGNVIADQGRVSLVVDQTNWRGAGVKGWITADYKGAFLTGIFETLGDKLVRLEVPLENGDLVLAAKSKALLTGTPTDPQVLVDLTGFAQLGLAEKTVLLGEIDARVDWRNGKAVLDRAVLSGPNGVVNASGSVSTLNSTLDIELEAAGIDLAAWTDQVSGVAYGSGRLTGPLDKPQLVMETTVVNIQAGEVTIPKGSATLVYAGGDILADNIEITYGLGSLTGQARYDLSDGGISGLLKAQDIFVADLIPGSPIVGRVGADQIALSGTVEKPEFAVNAYGEDILVSGVELTDVKLIAQGNLDRFTIQEAQAKIDDGVISASGSYSLANKRGRFEYTGTDLPLSRLPVDKEILEIAGMTSIQGVLETNSSGDWVSNNSIGLVGVTVNNFEAGSGSLSVNLRDKDLMVSGGFSSLNGLVEVPDASFNLENQDVSGQLYVTNLEIAGIIRAVSRQIKLPDIQTERVVRDFEGLVSADIQFRQVNQEWSVDVQSLTATNLMSLGRDLGALSLRGKGSRLDAEVGQLRWIIPSAEEGAASSIAEVSGTWKKSQSGEMVDTQGRLVGFDPYVLNLFMQDAPEFHARLNADFVASGPTDDLSGQASLTANNLQVRNADGELVDLPVEANVDTIEFENRTFNAMGKVRYQGIEGDISALVPLGAFDEKPTGDVLAKLELTPRPIGSLQEYVAGVDFERTRGSVRGDLSFMGNRNGYSLKGSAQFGADQNGPAQIAMSDSSMVLQNVELLLNTEGENVTLTGRADSSLGGDIGVEADVNLRKFLQGNLDVKSLKAATLEATAIRLNQFKFAEKIRLANPLAAPGEPAFLEASSPTVGVLNGEVNIGGTVEKPVISGEVSVANLNVSLPPAFPEGGKGGALEVDPHFEDFRLVALPGSVINIPTGNIKLSGSTVLNGDLSAIDIRAPFTVESGTLNLPASRVTLDEGTVLVTAGFGGDPRAEIDLHGWTVVTVRRTSDQYQTYRLNLEVQGNLLDPEGVRINGSSDPPDLSIEEIRAIVGQRDFIQSLLDTAFGNGDRRTGITESIFTLAIPSLTQQFTGSIAAALDLDYLVLDYNPFDGGIVRGGKEVFKGLMLEASRQLTPQNNQPVKFEVRLSYRPPTRDAFLSRFRISAGVTESVPWKVGISWTSRF